MAPAVAAFSRAFVQHEQQMVDDDAVWAYGSCAAQGDVWCLLQLAHLCAEDAALTAAPSPRRQQYATSRALLDQAAAKVYNAASSWDIWLTGGASAALDSFVALCSSSSRPFAAEQLAQVSALVTDAVSESGKTVEKLFQRVAHKASVLNRLLLFFAGGAELWALQGLLQRQEERLLLMHNAELA
jgi:hypothetical protein